MFLKEAHAWLGSLGWCCHNDGVLLKHFISLLRPQLKSLTALPTDVRQELLVELEQCYYCLYNHPQKKAKARGLQEHNSDPAELTWEAAQLLLEYFHPSYLPSIDDIKSPQVTPELISLYRRIIDAIPENVGQVLSKDVLSEYINGTVDTLPAPRPPQQHSSLISEIYYLLADDYLKSYDNRKAIDCYQSDLTYCPSRFDSWAGLALAWSRTITEKLEQRDTKKPIDKFIRKHAMPTVRCFKKAVSLNSKHCYMVEKFGFFCYSIQSFTSQVLHQPHLYKTPDIENWALTHRRSMLEMSEAQFSHALSLGGTKHAEPWIYHFMLGKIGRKLGKPVQEVLDHFLQSAETLYVEGANYPCTVEVNSKGHAMEAVEVHYQLFTSALKYLQKASDTDADHDNVEAAIRETVDSVSGLPLGKGWYPDVWVWLQSVLEQYREKKAASLLLPSQTAQNVETVCPADKSSVGFSTSHLQEPAVDGPKQLCSLSPTMIAPTLPLDNSPSTLHDEFVTCTSVTIPTSMEGVVSTPCNSTTVSAAVDRTAPAMEDIPPTPTITTVCKMEDVRPPIIPVSPASNSPSPILHVVCEEESMEEGENTFSVSDHGRVLSSDDSCEMNAIELAARDSVLAGDDGQEEKMPFSPEELWWSPTHEPLAQCLYSIAVCTLRSPTYFKSLYRLADTLTQLGLPQAARMFLLGPLPECFLCYQEKLLPLFVLKSNIFQNMWLIHVSEINRPGTFCSHARNCFLLLMSVLAKLKDLTSLVYVTQQIKSKPDCSRQFMRENERTAVYSKAVLRCVQVLEDVTNSEAEMKPSFEQQNKLLQEAYAVRAMATRTEGGKTKVVDQCMVGIFSRMWRHPEVQQLFDEDTRSTCDPGIEIVLKYCHLKGK